MKLGRSVAIFTLICISILFGLFLSYENRVEAAGPNTIRDFTLPNTSGKNVKLSSVYKANKLTIVNFFATWCPPCRAEIPDFIKIYKTYKKKGVEIVGVDLGEDQKTVKGFTGRFRINYPILLDSDNKVGEQYGIYSIPTTYIVDSKGKILSTVMGMTTEDALKSKIDALL